MPEDSLPLQARRAGKLSPQDLAPVSRVLQLLATATMLDPGKHKNA